MSTSTPFISFFPTSQQQRYRVLYLLGESVFQGCGVHCKAAPLFARNMASARPTTTWVGQLMPTKYQRPFKGKDSPRRAIFSSWEEITYCLKQTGTVYKANEEILAPRHDLRVSPWKWPLQSNSLKLPQNMHIICYIIHYFQQLTWLKRALCNC